MHIYIYYSEKFEPVNIKLFDFDGVSYHISTPDPLPLHVVVFSIHIPCFSQLNKYNASSIIAREAGQYLCDSSYGATPGTDIARGFSESNQYNVSFAFDLQQLRQSKSVDELKQLARHFSLLKQHIFAAPLERAFAEYDAGIPEDGQGELMSVSYREEESFFVQAKYDRVTVIYSVKFREEMDKVFGRVFLQEFFDARRQQSIQHAPHVLYSTRDPPAEIAHLPSVAADVANLPDDGSVGYVTFVLFPRHFQNDETRHNTASRLLQFRNYLHYHIKCSKAYMHSRMRARVSDLLKVLNRARPDKFGTGEKKLASGRSFRPTPTRTQG
ncbi:Arp2/3 complex, 34kDa subunit p34-Arc [Ramicandelaber brevisporus]|nr:Arp2/3 complex, 34kDa subunit p34-Arc [Ramicandelaber brevisporus]